MTNFCQFVRVEFSRFKALKTFTLHLRPFNILVGPNNAGKSTILAAFRILAAAMRKAESYRAEKVLGPNGSVPGHYIDLSAISVAEENIFFNYDDSEPAAVTFHLSNKHKLVLFFPEHGTAILIPDADGRPVLSPKEFKSSFKCPIGFVPILGPVEHHEPLFAKEAARLALFSYRAARNFRNIRHHYPEKFDQFRSTLIQTWPGMDIERPEIDRSHEKPRLHMYCPEKRIPREIFWSGFGFQVWCQMLTHLIQSSAASIFLVDEPDIYLHSDLQRQLLGILRNLGPDILIATHSTEIITEAEPDDIVLIDKARSHARRIRDATQLGEIFSLLGSNINPILTQLAKTRRVLFVEGKDFQILAKFARKKNFVRVANRSDFAVVPVQGFNPERIRNLKAGMEATLGVSIVAAAVLDRDYRCKGECDSITSDCRSFCDYVTIYHRKEIENFLLVPSAIDRAAQYKVSDRARRSGNALTYTPIANAILDSFADSKRNYVLAQHLKNRKQFERINEPGLNETTINERALDDFTRMWSLSDERLGLIPGKDAMSELNAKLQENYGVSVTPTAILDAMRDDEMPAEISHLLTLLDEFSSALPST